jgi:hypothetical protein
MSFLKKLGQVIATVGATALGVGPLVTPLFGSKGGKVEGLMAPAVNDLTAIGSLIIQIETALQGQDGADKFRAAVALVGPLIKTSQLVSGKKVSDPDMLKKGIDGVTQGVVDVLNSLHPDSVGTEVKA